MKEDATTELVYYDGSNANAHILDSKSKHGDNKTENFYPIICRVIGGGVMMSGESESSPVPRSQLFLSVF